MKSMKIPKTQLMTSSRDIYKGDIIWVTQLDNRWWKKLLHRVTFRKPPLRYTNYVVTSVDVESATLEIK